MTAPYALLISIIVGAAIVLIARAEIGGQGPPVVMMLRRGIVRYDDALTRPAWPPCASSAGQASVPRRPCTDKQQPSAAPPWSHNALPRCVWRDHAH
jgi:hypothetical protein